MKKVLAAAISHSFSIFFSMTANTADADAAAAATNGTSFGDIFRKKAQTDSETVSPDTAAAAAAAEAEKATTMMMTRETR